MYLVLSKELSFEITFTNELIELKSKHLTKTSLLESLLIYLDVSTHEYVSSGKQRIK